ncbi:MAG TPA: Gfo/Idh/MocA family oxidoreductase [Gaiellaceae bacterium]|nr:Gfo/Idh/MocA family oxidoreductase [Gaiellaceae bacterium]
MTVTVAILGGGFMASAHAAGYRALGERARVKWVASHTSDRARRVAESVGAELTSDLDTAIRDPEVDAVDICLPTPLHRESAERALAASKHVFLEKPIALTLADAEAIGSAAQASGRILMVGMVLRFWPEYVELRRRAAAGELGALRAVSTFRLSPPADWNEWMADRSRSGGTAVDLLVHDFDQMNWLLGAPVAVHATEPAPGHVQALVEYEGASGLAEGSMRIPSSYPFSSLIRVLGEDGVAEYAFSAAPVEGEGNIGASSSARGLRLHRAGEEAVTVPVESADPWGPEIAAFVDCLERGRPPDQGTPEQATLALRVSLAAVRSLASGRPETV